MLPPHGSKTPAPYDPSYTGDLIANIPYLVPTAGGKGTQALFNKKALAGPRIRLLFREHVGGGTELAKGQGIYDRAIRP